MKVFEPHELYDYVSEREISKEIPDILMHNQFGYQLVPADFEVKVTNDAYEFSVFGTADKSKPVTVIRAARNPETDAWYEKYHRGETIAKAIIECYPEDSKRSTFDAHVICNRTNSEKELNDTIRRIAAIDFFRHYGIRTIADVSKLADQAKEISTTSGGLSFRRI